MFAFGANNIITPKKTSAVNIQASTIVWSYLANNEWKRRATADNCVKTPIDKEKAEDAMPSKFVNLI